MAFPVRDRILSFDSIRGHNLICKWITLYDFVRGFVIHQSENNLWAGVDWARTISEPVLRWRRSDFHFRLWRWFSVILKFWKSWGRALMFIKKPSWHCHSMIPFDMALLHLSNFTFTTIDDRVLPSIRDNSVPIDGSTAQILQRRKSSKFRIRMFPSVDVRWRIIDYLWSHVQVSDKIGLVAWRPTVQIGE
jgi:hypothetical protein